MKRIILFTLLLVFSMANHASAQFVLTTKGIRNAEDLSKSYVVIPISKTQHTLYSETKKFLTSKYASAQDVLREAYPDLISLSSRTYYSLKIGWARVAGKIDYKINIYFKNFKLKIEFVIVKLHYDGYTMPLQNAKGTSFKYGIFKKNGQIRDDVGKADIEAIANDFVAYLTAYLNDQGYNSNDNW